MATATPVQANPGSRGPGDVICVSAKGDWQIANSDIGATEQSAANLIRPGGVSAANIVPVELGPRVTRALFRVRWGAAGAVTTSPIVRIIGVYTYGAKLVAGSLPDDASVRYLILASAQTITCVAATDLRDATYSYSAPISLTPTDLLGANYLLVFAETKATLAGVTPVVEVLVLN